MTGGRPGLRPQPGSGDGPPVGYIEKTHDYYRRLGYPIPYKYARFDTTPFAPLGKSLERCRVGLVATAGVILLDDDGPAGPHEGDGRRGGQRRRDRQ